MRFEILLALALTGTAAVPGVARAASLQSIGRLANHVWSEAVGVSDDGGSVAANSFDVDDVPHALRWTPGGSTPLTAPLDTNLFAENVSADGTAIVGSIQERDQTGEVVASEAFRWRQGTGVVGLGDAAGGDSWSVAYACSADGNLAVGVVNDATGTLAARWDGGALTPVGAGDLPGGAVDGAAYDVSSAGTVIAGDATTAAGFVGFRWTAGTGMVGLPDLPGGAVESYVDGVSPDGSVIVGWSDGPDGLEATRWVGGGDAQGLGALSGAAAIESFAYDASNGGARIVGEAFTASGYRAFLWDAANGMRLLVDVLEDLGVDTAGWTLETAYSISSDGRWVVGTGTTPQGDTEGFLVDLPEPGALGSAIAALLALRGLAARRSGC
jgi:uncharacterized membrane protein